MGYLYLFTSAKTQTIQLPSLYARRFRNGGPSGEADPSLGGLIRRYIYQLDVDVVGGRSAVEAHHDGVRLSTAEAERYLVASRVRPRCLRVREGQQTPGPTVATVAETISDTLCRQQLQTRELRYDTNHLSNFYIANLENFATASRRYAGAIHNSTVVGLFMTPTGRRKRLDNVVVECTCLLHIALL